MTFTDALDYLIGSPFTALVFALGVFGWWRLIARDSILDALRFKFFLRFPHEGFVGQQTRPMRGYSVYSGGVWYCTKGTFLGELVYCPYCLGWWIGIAQFGALLLAPELVMALALAHAVRIAAGFLAKHA
jgi:hypothetical protein